MKEDFYEIYKDLYEEYGSFLWPLIGFKYYKHDKYYKYGIRPIRKLKNTIDRAINKLDLFNYIRPDAKYFLLINFHELIVRPNLHPLNPYYNDDIMERLIEYIFDDTIMILRDAKESVGLGQEISSSIILKIISKFWNELKVNKLEIWG